MAVVENISSHERVVVWIPLKNVDSPKYMFWLRVIQIENCLEKIYIIIFNMAE